MDRLGLPQALDIKILTNGSKGMRTSARATGSLDGARIATFGSQIDPIIVEKFNAVSGEWITFVLGKQGP
jgi:hypothetical protein